MTVSGAIQGNIGGKTYVLHGDQVRANEWDVVDLLEHANNAGVIDSGNQDR